MVNSVIGSALTGAGSTTVCGVGFDFRPDAREWRDSSFVQVPTVGSDRTGGDFSRNSRLR